MPDPAAHLDSAWRSRDFEAQVLVDLLRLSRLTLLYGAEGAGKTTLLNTGVLPLLRRRADDRNAARSEKPRVVIPFPDRRARHEAIAHGAEIAIVFDRWSDTPLATLQASLVDVLPIKSARSATSQSLACSLARWNEEFGLRFFIIFDSFEQHLVAPLERAGIVEFDEEFVRMINEPGLAVHFLLSVRDDAEALLDRFRGRSKGFGDAFLRLPSLRHATAQSLPQNSQVHPLAAVAPQVAASETPPATRSASPRPSLVPGTASTVLRPVTRWKALFARAGAQRGALEAKEGALSHDPPPASTAGARTEPHAPVENPIPHTAAAERYPPRIALAAMIAGFAMAAGSAYFTIYGYPSSSSEKSASSATVATPPAAHTAALAPVVAPAASPVDAAQPSFLEQAPAVLDAAPPPPRPQTPDKRHRPTPKAVARAAPPDMVAVATAVAIDWQTAMQRDLEVCRQETFLARVVCTEKVRWKHCAPDRWNATAECGTGTP